MSNAREPLDPKVSLWNWLAFQLRFLRDQHGMTLDQVGALIGTARSTTSNIEGGRGRIDERQAFILDQRYGTGFLLQLLLYYARLGHDPEWFKQFSTYESQARVIKIYGGSVIPVPLQTEAYTRALLAAGPERDVDTEVSARMARQEALLHGENTPWIWVIFDEVTLHTAVGGRAAMREQMKHLQELAQLRHVSIRVILPGAGAHPGQDGPFRLISLEDRDVAYAGANRGGRLIEAPNEVRDLAVDFDRIGEKAITSDETLALIEERMEAFT
ncbi:helix-turn-helix transcriptional regulator [Actinocorallia lasiicapitis]